MQLTIGPLTPSKSIRSTIVRLIQNRNFRCCRATVKIRINFFLNPRLNSVRDSSFVGYEWPSHPSLFLFLFLFFKTTKAGSYFAFFFSFSPRSIHRIYGLTSKHARFLPLTAHLTKINNFGPYFLHNVGTKVKMIHLSYMHVR